jgi:hypothetical protein
MLKMKIIAERNLKDWTKLPTHNNEKKKSRSRQFCASLNYEQQIKRQCQVKRERPVLTSTYTDNKSIHSLSISNTRRVRD